MPYQQLGKIYWPHYSVNLLPFSIKDRTAKLKYKSSQNKQKLPWNEPENVTFSTSHHNSGKWKRRKLQEIGKYTDMHTQCAEAHARTRTKMKNLKKKDHASTKNQWNNSKFIPQVRNPFVKLRGLSKSIRNCQTIIFSNTNITN